MGRKKKRKISKPASREVRDRVVELRDAGMSWGKLSAELGMPSSTALGIWKRETAARDEVEEVEVKPAGPLTARVLKPFPNPRLVCIYFGERREERFAKCVVRPGFSWRPNSEVKVEEVEGGEELYRLA